KAVGWSWPTRRLQANNSHRTREAPALFAAQVGVEGHGDVAHHQVALGQQSQRIFANFHQSVGYVLVQLLERFGEIIAEDDAVALFDLAEVDAAVTHQRDDDVAP